MCIISPRETVERARRTLFYPFSSSGLAAGMTLVEIMVVVGILGILLLIAIPSWMNARNSAQQSSVISDLRIASAAFEQYSFFNRNQFPPDAAPGVMPNGMADYLGKMNWTGPSAVGGNWDWMPNVAGFGHAIGVVNTDIPESQMQSIDAKIDDGVLTSGRFRKVSSGTGFIYLIE